MRLQVYDTEFIGALHRGEHAAFEAAYAHFATSLRFFLDQVVENQMVAEDIATDAFIKTFNKYADFESLDKLKAYLYITASNAALDHVRNEKRHARSHEEILRLNGDRMEDVELAYIKAEVTQVIQEAIDALPQQPREVIRKIFLEDKKLSEVAAEMNLSYNTVQNHRTRGLALMRIRLEKNEHLSIAVLCLALSHLSAMQELDNISF